MGKGFGGMDFGKMMKQVQKMQADMMKLQEELAQKTVEASAGGGAVRAVVSGSLELKSLTIDAAAMDPDDPEMLQDLIVACVNEGLRMAREMVNAEMSKITGGLGLPSGMTGMF
ncbi:MAG TPA: YbaB/EbfC family nucleoid-associated protein [Clostridia bacterium]|nr:YbaB/EbfC family nucleoid-associated protein [Clostridia bacterium]